MDWEFGAAERAAWDALKEEICTPGKALARVDFSKKFILYTDLSNYGMGCILEQVDADGSNPTIIATYSRSLNKYERTYSSFQGEMLAVVTGVRVFRFYLHHDEFTVVTDHLPLKWLLGRQDLEGCLARWALILQEFKFTIQHRPGTQHSNVDVLSRFPQAHTTDIAGARLDHEWHKCVGIPPLNAADRVRLVNSAAGRQGNDHLSTAADLGDDEHDLAQVLAITGPDIPLDQLQLVEELRANATATLAGTRLPPPHHYPAQAVDNTVVSHAFFPAAETEGVMVIELFGGLCAGLDMCMRNQVKVARYVYCDIDHQAQEVARYRINSMAAQYPHLFSMDAVVRGGPSDVTLITPSLLRRWVRAAGTSPILVVAGWPCQDLSAAGKHAGLKGARSGLIYPLTSIIKQLQALAPGRVAYLLD